MKKLLVVSFALLLGVAVTCTTSCKKADSTTADDTPTQSQTASDDARVNSELENVSNEANTAISSHPNTAGAKVEGVVGVTTLPTDVKISRDSINGTVTLTYVDSIGLYGLYRRSGSIVIALQGYLANGKGKHWVDAGATIYVTLNNYKVTRIWDGKSIVFNGTKSITNKTGGFIWKLTSGQSLEHDIRANGLTITFDDGTQRTWSLHQNRTWTNITANNTANFQVSQGSDTTVAGYSNVSYWGTTRANNPFYVQLTSPLTVNSTCGWYRPTSGVRVINGLAHVVTETFGVDIAGNPVPYTIGGNCGAYGFKISWTNAAGQAKSKVIAY